MLRVIIGFLIVSGAFNSEAPFTIFMAGLGGLVLMAWGAFSVHCRQYRGQHPVGWLKHWRGD